MTLTDLFHNTTVQALAFYAGVALLNQATKEGSDLDKWSAAKAPRLHGLLLVLRGAGGYVPLIARGLFKALFGASAEPPPLPPPDAPATQRTGSRA